ncbi:hypothetical protein [Streptomyces hundungensis]|uniref:hypothetical protein n=1 Tax=Streptomyces hundungensis TaxID=1077946 RepID=UPI0033D03AA5
MSEQTPSKAEGERDQDERDQGVGTDTGSETSGGHEVPRTTPSQAEGDDTQDDSAEGSEAENS